MKFELSQELSDLVVFGMENQNVEQYLDSRELQLIERDHALALAEAEGIGEEEFADRFLVLPPWRSADGYNLMEQFVVSLRNPLLKDNLRGILQTGRGVFRQFKNALRQEPESEKRWFRFKTREMNRRVLEWYNDLRLLWGLAPLVAEEEADTEELLLSDFLIQVAGPEVGAEIGAWDRQLFDEAFPGRDADEADYLYRRRRSDAPLPGQGGDSLAVIAVSPAAELAGFLWVVESEAGDGERPRRFARIVQLGVDHDFRGLGMAHALVERYRRLAPSRGVAKIFLDLPAGASFMENGLRRDAWTVQATLWECDCRA